MKKYLILLFVALAYTLTSCEKDTDPGETAVQDMAGDWWVTCEYETSTGVWEDAGVGHVLMTTYNTAANLPTEMWINDGGNFWNFYSKVNVDYAAKTFSTSDYVSTNAPKYPDEKVKVTEGKVLLGAAKTPSGAVADSIIFYTQFNDDDNALTYKISGFRRTGFEQDDF